MITEQIAQSKVATRSNYSEDIISEHPKRSIAKSISWRIVGTLDTVIISWLITGTLSVAFSIGLVELGTKMLLYFAHERVWNVIKWGR